MLNSMTKPVSALTGGVIPTFCPGTPGLDDLMKPGVMGESAAITKDAAEAKARRAAVRVLGTVDCRYYPEVEGKLLAALRTDGSECVRYEAALALSHGCCCSKKVIDILTICVDGGEEDGAPAERSDRVRDTAMIGLQRCLSCVKVVEEPTVLPDPDNKIPDPEIDAPKKKDGLPKSKDEGTSKPSSNKADQKTVAKAREVIARHQAALQQAALAAPAVSPAHSVFEMFKYAEDGPSISSTTTTVTSAPVIVATPASQDGLRAARPVSPIQARPMPMPTAAPVVPAQPRVQAQPPAIQSTVIQSAQIETPVILPPMNTSGGTGPVIPAQVPAEPLPMPSAIPEPTIIPTAATAPVVPETPKLPAIPMPPPPAVEPEAKPVPPVIIIRPPSNRVPLPTNPFPD